MRASASRVKAAADDLLLDEPGERRSAVSGRAGHYAVARRDPRGIRYSRAATKHHSNRYFACGRG
ncbi:hypothetical protein CN645_20170 [Burkholderia sp. IDO3]|nr:hypothetical protein DCN14_33055 [Burkholderia sp. IDO3]PCD60088.1 hypothetical protein CN645_20170 [Burkholderia sp. IDO3]